MVRTRSREATTTGGRETNLLKLVVKPSSGWRASHQAVTKVNAHVASKRENPGSRAREPWAKTAWAGKTGRCVCTTPAGYQRRHGDKEVSRNWRSPTRPGGNPRRTEGPITGNPPGNGLEGERVADGTVVARSGGNAPGAKGPCCPQLLSQHGRQG